MIELIVNSPVLPHVVAEINMERINELQRFAEVGRLSAGLIHDMSSPLTAAILHLEQEEQRGLPSIRHARRSIRVLERYIEAARQQIRQQDRTASFYIKRELNQVKQILQPLARRQGISLRFRVPANYQLVGDPIKFQRIISNLIVNALDSYQDTDTKNFAPLIQVIVSADSKWLDIRVKDWGKGITAGQLPCLFEPFYTTKQPRAISGTGIGLSTVKQCVEDDFGGTITLTSSATAGTEFRVTLRLCKNAK
ncbi:MAG TPA: HAMP domain-containing sensor histidine kinase [Candidatus Saccharimonadales bacterium]|nr:HAMP domain-containing sensor histidine kinase [Candidatus Saccharimonadales bacterium]